MSSAEFVVKATAGKNRECIGYDYSENAVSIAANNGVNARLIDLCSINNGQLAYQDMIELDLSVATNIIAIRVLEYLNPQAVILLIFSLMNAAKPGSTLYFETCLINHSPLSKEVCHDIENNYVASFFAPRTDKQFRHHSINVESIDDLGGMEGTNNRLIVSKL